MSDRVTLTAAVTIFAAALLCAVMATEDAAPPVTPSQGAEATSAPSEDGSAGESRVVALPSDPFQRCAVRALRGDWGPLPDWKRDAYQWGLDHGVTVPSGNLSRVTSYGPFERCGTETFSGERVSLKWVSVDPKVVPLGAIVWTPRGLRYAMDTGGAVKVQARYLKRGENQNLDYYALNDWGRITLPWVIVKTKTDWNWYGIRKWRDWSRQGPWRPGVK